MPAANHNILKLFAIVTLCFAALFISAVKAKPFQQLDINRFIIVSPIEAKWIKKAELKVISAYQQLGIDVEIIKLPAKRALIEANNSEWVDAELGRAGEAQGFLKDYIKLPVELFFVDVVAVSREAIKSLSWSNLENHQVVTLRGLIGITNRLDKHITDYQQTTNLQQIFKMLERNRADVAILPKAFVTQKILSELNQTTAFDVATLEQVPIYHFIHKRHQQIVPELTTTFQTLFPIEP